jgi:uncharacterized SAM-binding protein YcdF (DUF218 family)
MKLSPDAVSRRLAVILRTTGMVIGIVFLATASAPLMDDYLISRFTEVPRLEPADAIVVLGGGLLKNGQLDGNSLYRTIHAVSLYKVNFSGRVLFLGPPRTPNTIPESETRRRLAERMGIPAEQVLTDSQGLTTREEALRSNAILGAGKRILLVTDSMHMWRASLTFAKVGFSVLPAPSEQFQHGPYSALDRIYLMRRTLEELVGLLYYRLNNFI